MQTDLTEQEQVLFKEVAEVMAGHPELRGKFGLWRVHGHFPMQVGEVLLEQSDAGRRQSVIEPVAAGNVPEDAFATQWTIGDDGQPRVFTMCGRARCAVQE